MSALPAAIRKAAILVTALDERAADALLAQMGPEMAARVRNAMMGLDDIHPAEQQAVLTEFLRGGNRSGGTGDSADGGVELELSLDQPSEPAPAIPARSAAVSTTPSGRRFDFLTGIPPRNVAQALNREQPQTISVVIAQLDAAVAAQLLENLPADVATDVLERMAWLDEPADEVVADIEQQLRRNLAPWLAGAARRPESLANLHAVLGAMEQSSRGRVLAGLEKRNRSLSQRLGSAPAAANSTVASFRYRLARPEIQTQYAYRLVGSAEKAAAPLVEFDDFVSLSDEALRRIFAAAEPQVVLLALTGADEQLLERIVSQLPAKAAAALRARLNHPGAVRLRDIEAAQQELAEIARRLAALGQIAIPGSRHFAAAA